MQILCAANLETETSHEILLKSNQLTSCSQKARGQEPDVRTHVRTDALTDGQNGNYMLF